MTTSSTQRGYTLLFAVLTAVLVLGVAAFILEFTTKEYELSASARDSMYSYYAADSGIECVALNNSVYSTPGPDSITCGSYSAAIPVTYQSFTYVDSLGVSHPGAYETEDASGNTWFSLQFEDPESSQITCARVTIIVYQDQAGNYHNLVQSRGYNHCSGTVGTSAYGPDITNPTTVERALQLSHSSAPPVGGS